MSATEDLPDKGSSAIAVVALAVGLGMGCGGGLILTVLALVSQTVWGGR
jgi:hypothetical protein